MRRDSVRLVALVARRDYLRTVRRRGFVAGTLLLPLAMVALLGISTLASTGGFGSGQTGPIVVINESQIPLIPDQALTPDIRILPRTTAEQQMAAGALPTYFLVPSSWPAHPRIRSVQRSRGAGNPIEALARSGAQQAQVDLLLRISITRGAGIPDEVLAQLLTPVTIEAIDDSGAPVSEASVTASFLVPYAFTLIFILSLFITSGYLLQSVTEEKENRVVEILLSSVPALPLMAGKIIGLGAAGLTQIAIWVGTALVALPFANQQFSINVGLSPITLVLAVFVFALGYLGYGAIFAAVGALAPGSREGQQYGSFFGFIAVIPLILMSVFLSDPGSPIVIALCLLPLTAPAALLQLLAVSSTTPWLLVGASLVAQTLFVIVAVVASSRIFRATLLLYGVRPSVRRIADAIFARG
ncbi:MAG: ABC transporter permease [Candidatus Limnocylindrales bacterium]